MTTQNKKDIILGLLVVVLLVGITGYSVYQYQENRKPAPTESISQLKKDKNNAIRTMQIHDGVNKIDLDQANKQTAFTQSKLDTVCAQLKSAKLVQPLCN